jgi:hypothetical protein
VWAFVYYAVKSLNARSLHRCTLVDFWQPWDFRRFAFCCCL